MTVSDYLERLIENSKEKYIIISEILNITKAQSEVLNEDAMESLEQFINLKQTLLDRISKLDEDFEVYFKRLKTTLGIKSFAEISEDFLIQYANLQNSKGINKLDIDYTISIMRDFKDIITEISEMINKITNLESENNKNANVLLNSFAAEVRKINHAKVASSAYQPGGGLIKPPSYFIDKKK
jgi:hypothetical protein